MTTRDIGDSYPRSAVAESAVAGRRDPLLLERHRSEHTGSIALWDERDCALDLVGARDPEPVRVLGRLGTAAQTRALKTPQRANNNDPRRIRAKAAATRTKASGILKSGAKLCGMANRWAMDRLPAGSACGSGRASHERIFCVIISLSAGFQLPCNTIVTHLLCNGCYQRLS